jgi:hypothetical protein
MPVGAKSRRAVAGERSKTNLFAWSAGYARRCARYEHGVGSQACKRGSSLRTSFRSPAIERAS